MAYKEVKKIIPAKVIKEKEVIEEQWTCDRCGCDLTVRKEKGVEELHEFEISGGSYFAGKMYYSAEYCGKCIEIVTYYFFESLLKAGIICFHDNCTEPVIDIEEIKKRTANMEIECYEDIFDMLREDFKK